jgi:hypothetical protein
MRDFTDRDGNAWTATIREEEGTDYKGRIYLVFRPSGRGESDELVLADVRWNSERTARRTLRTMSEVELRRRLRSALGRSRTPAGA